MPLLRRSIFVVICCLFLLPAFGQKKDPPRITRVLFVFDASNSMKAMYDGKPRIDHAKVLFNRFIDSLSKNKTYEFALRMYGSVVKYPPGDCNDSKLIVPFGKNNIAQIKEAVAAAKPTGITPIEHSLTQSADDFPDNNSINTIILITDGIEECSGDPCAAKQKLYDKGIIFRPCIIGIGLSVEQAKSFDCVGNYFSYEDTNVVKNVVKVVTSQRMDKTSVQVNLLDLASKPTETNVNMTFYDEKTGQAVYNYVHSMNIKGNPDTVMIDGWRTYTLIAHTIPPVQKTGITLNMGVHNIIALDAPQGIVQIKRDKGFYNFNEKIRCVVRKSGDANTLNVQNMNDYEKYIVGTYDIEVLTLPRTYFNKVSVQQTLLKTLTVEDAGMVKVKCKEVGDGCILLETKDGLKWVCNLEAKTEQIFYLQPGKYRITYRSKSIKQTLFTVEKKFTVSPGDTQTIDLFTQ